MNEISPDNKTFCMAPWVHLHTTPAGTGAPCCISEILYDNIGVGDTKTNTIFEVINSDKMKEIRLAMMAGKQTPSCSACYRQEAAGSRSFRQTVNIDYNKYLPECLSNTTEDGTLTEFKMRYFDIRFSNICNFKCRTCFAGYSSLWEQEDLKYKVGAPVIAKNNRKGLLPEILEHIEFMDAAYFAGGEPLITSEHYTILEEMIRQKRTDIKLTYNTNLSNIKFKDKDLIDLWSHFTNRVSVYASIDHYGRRAEYIRHGTDWAQVESNYKAVQQLSGVELVVNSVVSIFNCLTLYDFHSYMIDKQLFKSSCFSHSLYNLGQPSVFDDHLLPKDVIDRSVQNLQKTRDMWVEFASNSGTIVQIEQSINQLLAPQPDMDWKAHRQKIQAEIERVDKIRGENFSEVFPELTWLLE